MISIQSNSTKSFKGNNQKNIRIYIFFKYLKYKIKNRFIKYIKSEIKHLYLFLYFILFFVNCEDPYRYPY